MKTEIVKSYIVNKLKLFPFTFWICLALVSILSGIGILLPVHFLKYIKHLNDLISKQYGSFYLYFGFFSLIILVLIGISPLGKIRLGGEESRPDYSFYSWFSMIFAAGMGTGILFWGGAEPLYHFMNSPISGQSGVLQREITAFHFTFFHWGLHPWAIYGFTGLLISFFSLNLKRGIYISSFLQCNPESGTNKRIIKHLIDIVTILAILFGVSATFGMGVLQFEGGLYKIFSINPTVFLRLIIIFSFTILYLISSINGIEKGIKLFSNICTGLSIILLLLILFLKPLSHTLAPLILSMPSYFSHLPSMSLGMLNYSNSHWISDWTIKYWSWWIAWAPFVGIFIALISKGRTVRELVTAVLLAPTIFSYIWFYAFGDAAISLQNKYLIMGKVFDLQESNLVFFDILNKLFNSEFVSVLCLFIIATFFINSADSATYALASLSSQEKGGFADKHPPKTLQIAWGVMFATLASLFLFTGGIDILQEVTLIGVFPFTILLTVVFIILIFEMIKYKYINKLNYLEEDIYPD